MNRDNKQTAFSADAGYAFGSGHALLVLLILCLIQIASFLDRQIINLLVEPIRRDLMISDTKISLLQGLAFSLFYGLIAIPLGRVADTKSRKWVITGGMTLWSFATIFCMFAHGYTMLFLARMLVSVGEATLTPSGYSLLTDYFPREKLGRAIACFSGAGFLGSGITLVFGGVLIAHLSQLAPIDLPLVGQIFAWQLAFGIATIPTLVLLLVMPLMREPPRRGKQVATSQPTGDVIKELRTEWRLWIPIIIGLPIAAAVPSGLLAWTPSFFIRSYGWSLAEIGPIYGAEFVIFGTLGVLFGGWLGDYLVAKGWSDGFIRSAVFCPALNLPLVLIFALCGNAWLSVVLLAPISFLSSMPYGAGSAAIPCYAPTRMRAQIMAIYLLCYALLGAAAGPWLIAFSTDFIVGRPDGIGYPIAIMSLLVLPLSFGLLLYSLPKARQRMAALARGEI
jgi:MFS family permease